MIVFCHTPMARRICEFTVTQDMEEQAEGEEGNALSQCRTSTDKLRRMDGEREATRVTEGSGWRRCLCTSSLLIAKGK